MKKVIQTTISILIIVMVVSINTASAEKRQIVLEMGESGQTVSFPITSEEIAVVDPENAGLTQGGALDSKKNAPRFLTIEMAESGEAVSFLMAPEEIAVEDVKRLRLSKIRRKSYIGDRKTIAYEMAESGMLIEFLERAVRVNSVSIAKVENP